MWLLPGQLPPGVREEMLTPIETHEDEIAAAQEDMDASMAEIIRKHCGAKGEGGAGPQREAAVVAPVVAETEAAGEPRVSEPVVVIPDEGGTRGGSMKLAVAGPAAPVVAVPEQTRPTPPPEPVSPSRAAPPFGLAPVAVPTKAEAERIAMEERERKRVRRWA
jgi:hypothetical protein